MSRKTGFRHTEETKRKLSEARKGSKNPFYGKTHTAETKKKLAQITREKNLKRQYTINDVSIAIPDSNILSYITGIIDADGSIRMKKKSVPTVAIYNNNRDLMDFLVTHIGGHYRLSDKRGRDPGYCWQITAARDVYLLCKSIVDLLIVKKNDALETILFLEGKYGKERLNGHEH